MVKLFSGVIAALAGTTLTGGAPAQAPAPAPPELAYTFVNHSSTVWLADADGKHAHALGVGTAPLLSPDGAFVAVSPLGSKGSRLVIYQRGLKKPRDYFAHGVIGAAAQAWSSDSRYLAVELLRVAKRPSPEMPFLALIDTRTGEVKTIAKGSLCGASFAPRPRDRLVYGSAPVRDGCFGADVNLYTVAPDGSGRRALTRDGVSLNPVWGAHWIAFDREKLGRMAAPMYQVWMMDADGTHRRQLTHLRVSSGDDGLVPLAFSADGNRLLMDYEGEGTAETWTMQFPAGVAKQLKVGGQSVVPGAIARDGASVLVTAGGFQRPPTKQTIEVVPFGGGRPTVIVRDAGEPSWNR